jgi:hypothetical protein
MYRHLDWQVSSAIQILTALQPVLSVVEQLTLSHMEHYQSIAHRGAVFSDPLAICLCGKLSRPLQADEGESPLELLDLKELGYCGALDAFTPFIDE